MIKGTSANLVPYIRYIPCNAFMLHHLTMVIFLLRFNVMCTLLSVTPLFKEAILILFIICLTWESKFCLTQDSIVIPSCEIEWKHGCVRELCSKHHENDIWSVLCRYFHTSGRDYALTVNRWCMQIIKERIFKVQCLFTRYVSSVPEQVISTLRMRY